MKLPIPRAYKLFKKEMEKNMKKSNKIYKEFDKEKYTFKELRFGDIVFVGGRVGVIIHTNPKGNNKKRKWNYYLVIYEDAKNEFGKLQIVYDYVREDKIIMKFYKKD